ncbi:hypothetical protein D3H35_00450 [Cohnella faecalis]|uniref:Carbohydrate ABC transporter permease n=1 Tax=Cohnella faecalis TaxID=2315694 RepID=A0A398CPU4_9BACL|nr:hypothetical protein D3H35_00450 [Cohnella faecalis]
MRSKGLNFTFSGSLKSLMLFIAFGLIVIVNIVPILWGLKTSIMSPSDIFSYPPKLFNFEASFEHYIESLTEGIFKPF